MALPRRLLVDPARSGVYHCTSRCVRRAFLCGRDHYSGQNYEHRRAWVRERLRELVGLFAIELHSYAVMSNHLHVIVRTQPEWVKRWDDREVARRWLSLFPGAGARRGCPREDSALDALCRDREKLARSRARLADLSWFMRCLNEPIARRANHEDECTGRFWEGRFKCEKLADEGAILACMSYVDLNPVRAGISTCLEESDFTSAQDRLVAAKARRQLACAPGDPTSAQAKLIARSRADAQRDSWLAPIGAGRSEAAPDRPVDEACGRGSCPAGRPRVAAEEGGAGSPGPSALLTRFSPEEYLELLDWTGRQFRSDKPGAISPHLRPLLQGLELDVEAWVENVEAYGGLFFRVAGKLEALRKMALATGQAWMRGRRGAQQLYAGGA